MNVNFEIRRFAKQAFASAEKIVRGTNFESIAVCQVEPPEFELSRAGRRFQIGVLSTVTGIAPVQAVPTIAAQWLLYNPHPTRAMVLDWAGILLVSGTAGAGIVLLGGLVAPGTLPTTLPTANATGVKCGPTTSGQASVPNSSLIVASGQTLAAAPANGWFSLAKGDSANTAVLSVAAENRDIKGKIVIPPLHGLALAVTSPVGTTPLFVPQASWTELDADLE